MKKMRKSNPFSRQEKFRVNKKRKPETQTKGATNEQMQKEPVFSRAAGIITGIPRRRHGH
ncbi:MAG: hypothetical protein KFF46_04375 [Desulfobacterales bacterium]|nr:hypothetical protein [Desulfobacterales bacterium]